MRSHTETDKSLPSVVSCVMGESISSKKGLSPPQRSADFSQTSSYTSIYTFTSSPTGSSLCSTHLEGCIPHVFFLCCFFPRVFFPIPPLSDSLLPLSTLPPALSCLPPSSIRLIRLYAAKHKFTERGTQGEREGSEAETVRTEKGAERAAKEQLKRGDALEEMEGKGWRTGSVGERRGGGGKSCSCCSDGRSSPQFLRGQKFTVVLISPFRSQSELISGCWKEL